MAFHSYETLEQAGADGWTRSVAMVDVTEPPSFGYDWAIKDEDGNIVARSTSVWISQARNRGGSTGAVYPMFRTEEDDPPAEKRPAFLLRFLDAEEKATAEAWSERMGYPSLTAYILQAITDYNQKWREHAGYEERRAEKGA